MVHTHTHTVPFRVHFDTSKYFSAFTIQNTVMEYRPHGGKEMLHMAPLHAAFIEKYIHPRLADLQKLWNIYSKPVLTNRVF